MRFSINSHGISAQAKGWGRGWPTNRVHDMTRVKADRSGTSINVHKRIARLVDMLLDETERRGYRLNPHKCGGYVCRQIFGKGHRPTGRPSNHSWGLAIDLNWNSNVERWDGKVVTDMPSWLPKLWGRYGFFWGANYSGGHRDPMHVEFMGSPDDADDMTAKARRELRGGKAMPAPAHKATPQVYVVRSGDSLGLIANRFRLNGWTGLYNLNKAVIGPDPDVIKPGQKLVIPAVH